MALYRTAQARQEVILKRDLQSKIKSGNQEKEKKEAEEGYTGTALFHSGKKGMLWILKWNGTVCRCHVTTRGVALVHSRD